MEGSVLEWRVLVGLKFFAKNVESVYLLLSKFEVIRCVVAEEGVERCGDCYKVLDQSAVDVAHS